MSTPLNGIEEALVILRKQERLTQGEVAERASINVSSLSRYERGKVEISVRVLDRILVALGADLPKLDRTLKLARQESPEPTPPSPDILADLNKIGAMDAKEFEVLVSLAKMLRGKKKKKKNKKKKKQGDE